MKFRYTIIALLFFISNNSYSQNSTFETIKYYTLTGTNTDEDAKKAIHILSKCFDEMPEYDFETKRIKITTSQNIPLKDLNARLNEFGFILFEENNPNQIINKN